MKVKLFPLTFLMFFCFLSNAHSAIVYYKYDNLSQLSKAEYSNGATFHYDYDHIGNREQTSVSVTVFKLGDIDGDSIVDLTDMIIGLQICSGEEAPLGVTLFSDVNANRQIDLSEVLYIMGQLAL